MRDIGLSRAPDVALFQLAREQGRVMVTLDLDFAEIVAFSRGAVVSAVLLRLGQPTAPLIVERLTAVLEAAVPALDKGAIVVVEKSRYRVRHLPIGA